MSTTNSMADEARSRGMATIKGSFCHSVSSSISARQGRSSAAFEWCVSRTRFGRGMLRNVHHCSRSTSTENVCHHWRVDHLAWSGTCAGLPSHGRSQEFNPPHLHPREIRERRDFVARWSWVKTDLARRCQDGLRRMGIRGVRRCNIIVSDLGELLPDSVDTMNATTTHRGG
jgi:hypothetical protein